MLSLLSIDIGLRTLSLYKEYFDVNKASLISYPNQCYNKFGEATEKMKSYVDNVGKCGICAFIVKKDLGEKKDYFSGKALFNLFNFLDDIDRQGIFDDIEVIIIEKQMLKNNIATALMHHIQSWFLITYGPFKKVILFPSKNKTRVLGAPLKQQDDDGKTTRVDKSFRKKWSTLRAYQILNHRNDENTIDYIFNLNKSKKDDLSDVITQALAYNILKLKRLDK
jgi:hypothetical protein